MTWTAPDLTLDNVSKVHTHHKELGEILGSIDTLFTNHDDIANMTYEQALWVLRYARRTLLSQLMYQEYHEHMLDDCGDDLIAATTNWNRLYSAYFDNDGDEAAFVTAVKEFMQDVDDLGGCGGEVRFDVVSDELQDLLYYPES